MLTSNVSPFFRPSPNEMARLKDNEFKKRRMIRLAQVRHQANEYAAKIRYAFKASQELELKKLAMKIQQAQCEEDAITLDNLRSEYERCLASVGSGHKKAAKEVDPSVGIQVKSKVNQQRATERFKLALDSHRDAELERKRDQEERASSRRSAQETEKERAKRVAALPTPQRPPYLLSQEEKFLRLKEAELAPPPTVTVCDFKASSFIHVEPVPSNVLVQRHFQQTQNNNLDDDSIPRQFQLKVNENQSSDAWIAGEKLHNHMEDASKRSEMESQEREAKAVLRGREAHQKEVVRRDYQDLMSHLEDHRRDDYIRRQRIFHRIPTQIFALPNQLVREKRMAELAREKAFEAAVVEAYNRDARLAASDCIEKQPPAAHRTTEPAQTSHVPAQFVSDASSSRDSSYRPISLVDQQQHPKSSRPPLKTEFESSTQTSVAKDKNSVSKIHVDTTSVESEESTLVPPVETIEKSDDVWPVKDEDDDKRMPGERPPLMDIGSELNRLRRHISTSSARQMKTGKSDKIRQFEDHCDHIDQILSRADFEKEKKRLQDELQDIDHRLLTLRNHPLGNVEVASSSSKIQSRVHGAKPLNDEPTYNTPPQTERPRVVPQVVDQDPPIREPVTQTTRSSLTQPNKKTPLQIEVEAYLQAAIKRLQESKTQQQEQEKGNVSFETTEPRTSLMSSSSEAPVKAVQDTSIESDKHQLSRNPAAFSMWDSMSEGSVSSKKSMSATRSTSSLNSCGHHKETPNESISQSTLATETSQSDHEEDGDSSLPRSLSSVDGNKVEGSLGSCESLLAHTRERLVSHQQELEDFKTKLMHKFVINRAVSQREQLRSLILEQQRDALSHKSISSDDEDSPSRQATPVNEMFHANEDADETLTGENDSLADADLPSCEQFVTHFKNFLDEMKTRQREILTSVETSDDVIKENLEEDEDISLRSTSLMKDEYHVKSHVFHHDLSVIPEVSYYDWMSSQSKSALSMKDKESGSDQELTISDGDEEHRGSISSVESISETLSPPNQSAPFTKGTESQLVQPSVITQPNISLNTSSTPSSLARMLLPSTTMQSTQISTITTSTHYRELPFPKHLSEGATLDSVSSNLVFGTPETDAAHQKGSLAITKIAQAPPMHSSPLSQCGQEETTPGNRVIFPPFSCKDSTISSGSMNSKVASDVDLYKISSSSSANSNNEKRKQMLQRLLLTKQGHSLAQLKHKDEDHVSATTNSEALPSSDGETPPRCSNSLSTHSSSQIMSWQSPSIQTSPLSDGSISQTFSCESNGSEGVTYLPGKEMTVSQNVCNSSRLLLPILECDDTLQIPTNEATAVYTQHTFGGVNIQSNGSISLDIYSQHSMPFSLSQSRKSSCATLASVRRECDPLSEARMAPQRVLQHALSTNGLQDPTLVYTQRSLMTCGQSTGNIPSAMMHTDVCSQYSIPFSISQSRKSSTSTLTSVRRESDQPRESKVNSVRPTRSFSTNEIQNESFCGMDTEWMNSLSPTLRQYFNPKDNSPEMSLHVDHKEGRSSCMSSRVSLASGALDNVHPTKLGFTSIRSTEHSFSSKDLESESSLGIDMALINSQAPYMREYHNRQEQEDSLDKLHDMIFMDERRNCNPSIKSEDLGLSAGQVESSGRHLLEMADSLLITAIRERGILEESQISLVTAGTGDVANPISVSSSLQSLPCSSNTPANLVPRRVASQTSISESLQSFLRCEASICGAMQSDVQRPQEQQGEGDVYEELSFSLSSSDIGDGSRSQCNDDCSSLETDQNVISPNQQQVTCDKAMRAARQKDALMRTQRLWNRLDEVKHQKQAQTRKVQQEKNRERMKAYAEKLREQRKKMQSREGSK